MSFGLLLLILISAEGATNAAPADLLGFMAEYSQVVLHADRAEEAAEPRLDFWKGGTDEGNREAAEYLRTRDLFSDLEAGAGRVFFLRVLTDEEMKEVFHFKVEVTDPAIQQAIHSPFFRYALVRMVNIDRNGVADAEALSLAPGQGPSVAALKEKVAALGAASPKPENPPAPVAPSEPAVAPAP